MSIIAKYRDEGSQTVRPAPEGCTECCFDGACLFVKGSSAERDGLDSLVAVHRAVRRGEPLFRRGELLSAIFAVKSGFFKTRISLEDGREQITRFQMPGEVLGLDGIGTGKYSCDAIALADSPVCGVDYVHFERISCGYPEIQRQFERAMSHEIVREQEMMLLLSSMRSEEKVADFLLDLSQRFNSRGLSPLALELPMTRHEIGAYLGMSLETVSQPVSFQTPC